MIRATHEKCCQFPLSNRVNLQYVISATNFIQDDVSPYVFQFSLLLAIHRQYAYLGSIYAPLAFGLYPMWQPASAKHSVAGQCGGNAFPAIPALNAVANGKPISPKWPFVWIQKHSDGISERAETKRWCHQIHDLYS